MNEQTQMDASNENQDEANNQDVNENLDKPKKIIINFDLSDKELLRIIEAAIFSVGQTISVDRLMDLFTYDKHPGKMQLKMH